jgi:hypothetical protein
MQVDAIMRWYKLESLRKNCYNMRMIYRAEILAEAAIASEHLEAAAGSIIQLADSMGVSTDPDITLKIIPDDVLALNSWGQVDRTVIDAVPYDESLKLLVTARDLGVGDSEASRLNYVFGTSRLGRVVMSTLRVRTSDDFGSLVLHEAGHAEGLVQPSERNYNRLSVRWSLCQPVSNAARQLICGHAIYGYSISLERSFLR